ncbi:hypothetical protein GGR52DRAFT_581082 [Hypoxylon sp. FL1284]|nr:hypothetical protein GGR52DRAFT_581082 [Hypoxylon sp. FL1284]
MTKVHKSDPDLPSRSDSFLRMLELEKKFRMQRIQGHAPPPPILPPSTTSPSVQPNRPFEARRASGHPPLSHQPQIMKAVRRNTALPSLSISIPPSPTELGTDGLPGAPQSKHGERIKTVTFSGDDDGDDGDDKGAFSDQSSICQSPSWERYGRKKPKKSKKRDEDQDTKSKEKSANTLKKKGNRLSKLPPLHVKGGVESLAATDHSQSAPELDIYLKSNAGILDTPNSTDPDRMANQKANGKPKSKGFLSSFRLQHGNVVAVQKIIDGQRGSTDGDQAPESPMLKPHPAASAIDPNFTNPRKPPSIRSAVSNSTRSISSLDQLPAARHTSNSSHGRSQSLLSSTLNKLKGPSYLYYRPTEGAEDVHFQQPSSPRGNGAAPGWSNDRPTRQPVERQPEMPAGQLTARAPREPIREPHQQLPDFAFPPKPKQATSQPAANIAARRVQNQAPFVEPRDINSGYESPEPTSFRNRHAQMPPPRAPSRESALEREKRARSDRVPRTSKQYVESPWNEENRPQQPRQPGRAFERQHYPVQQLSAYVQPQVEAWEESKHGPEISPSSQHREENIDEDGYGGYGQSAVNLGREPEEDQVSVRTHASTIRPRSRRQGHSSPEIDETKHVTFPPSPIGIGTAATSDIVDMEEPNAVAEPSPPMEPIEKQEVVRTEKPTRMDRSADYFSFISQSYAPPSLELRSPVEGKFPSPRIDEEPEEDDDDDLDHVLRHIPVRGQGSAVASQSELTTHTVPSNMNAPSRPARHRPAKDSPSMSSHHSDSDVPAFERLGLSTKAARILAGAETSSTSTSQSNTDPSRTTSERSSSSTCDDAPPTPDSSRPQSRKGHRPSNADTASNTSGNPGADAEDATPRKSYRQPLVAPQPIKSSRPSDREVNVQDDTWSRTALPIDLDSQSAEISSNKPSTQTPSPPLAATLASVTFAGDAQDNMEAEELIPRNPYHRQVPLRAQSALELHSAGFANHHQPPYAKKANGGISASSISLPNSPPSEPTDVAAAPRKSAMRMSRKYGGGSSHSDETTPPALVSPGAAYLQEARKAAQIGPLGPLPASRALPQPQSHSQSHPPSQQPQRPHFSRGNSSGSGRSAGGTTATAAITTVERSEPRAKMLVECCSCKFFHDMPSRVYECMAKPDSLVEDKLLGVSATVTTMVKCPWCAHGMSAQCCAGYAAVIYLKEKLHGK